uniref:Uncharacterized protein n=1 Tax=uncultured alpha proteobacterium HF0070_05I22 TaxID=710803 RepID=E0XX92_9PROT|nr:hypothetical protein [uncultured alpha proteobacterium HF0070_05I22]
MSLTVCGQNVDTQGDIKHKKRPQLLIVATYLIYDLFDYLVAGVGFEPTTFRL